MKHGYLVALAIIGSITATTWGAEEKCATCGKGFTGADAAITFKTACCEKLLHPFCTYPELADKIDTMTLNNIENLKCPFCEQNPIGNKLAIFKVKYKKQTENIGEKKKESIEEKKEEKYSVAEADRCSICQFEILDPTEAYFTSCCHKPFHPLCFLSGCMARIWSFEYMPSSPSVGIDDLFEKPIMSLSIPKEKEHPLKNGNYKSCPNCKGVAIASSIKLRELYEKYSHAYASADDALREDKLLYLSKKDTRETFNGMDENERNKFLTSFERYKMEGIFLERLPDYAFIAKTKVMGFIEKDEETRKNNFDGLTLSEKTHVLAAFWDTLTEDEKNSYPTKIVENDGLPQLFHDVFGRLAITKQLTKRHKDKFRNLLDFYVGPSKQDIIAEDYVPWLTPEECSDLH